MTTITAKPTKPPTTLPPTSSIHSLATVTATHPLTLADHTYIHLRAHLTTAHAPLTIGSNCIVAEKATVGLLTPKDEGSHGDEQTTVILEDFVVVESKAVVEGSSIGEGTVVKVGAKVEKGAVVGKYCKIGPLCSIAPYEKIPDHTVIYGHNERRIDRSGTDALRAKTVEQHVEVLKKAELAARKK
ncbi:MAG: hypothetical protein Q9166_001315 [cf. Caloplaca sp. 2 TL-2023]